MECPKAVVVISGKRKSGKDFISDILLERQSLTDRKPNYQWAGSHLTVTSYEAEVRKANLNENEHRLGASKCGIFRLSGPLKLQYAKEHNLDFEKLLDATEYKEKYRADMIAWGEERRKRDPSFFCQLATSDGSSKMVWLISDARRLTDVNYFKQKHSIATITVRVECDNEMRQQRGFIFTEGVDDAESECGLDTGVNWDIIIYNNGDKEKLEESLTNILELIAIKCEDH